MPIDRLRFESRYEVPVAELFAWHTRPGALERLMPPWEPMQVIAREGGIEEGARVVLKGRMGPFPMIWEAVHTAYEEGRLFRDELRRGPFARWVHTHSFRPGGEGASTLEDSIEYAMPLGAFGRLFGGKSVRRRVERVFAYRHELLRGDLRTHAKGRVGRVLVTGSSGLVGTQLRALLTTGGNEAVAIPRGEVAPAMLEGADAVVHLAGENIAARRWSRAQKERIRVSRVAGTGALATALAALQKPPRVLVCASAVGYYGNTGETEVDERSESGDGFLAEVCREWEGAAGAARAAGIRVVHLRFGVVLSPLGGALKKMLVPFRMGVGGKLGSGQQFMSWISLNDAIDAIHHACCTPDLAGAVNVVAPQAVRQREFARTLARVLRRPAFLPMPRNAVRTLFGEMGEELLLGGQRVRPRRLAESAFAYRHPELEGALRFMLGIPVRR